MGAYVYTTYDSTGDGEHDARAGDETDVNGAYEVTGIPVDQDYTVYAIKGSFEASFDVSVGSGMTEIPSDECMLEPPDIAVVTGDYDHIEDIIGGMGFEYTEIDGQYTTEYLPPQPRCDGRVRHHLLQLRCRHGLAVYRRGPGASQHSGFVANGGSMHRTGPTTTSRRLSHRSWTSTGRTSRMTSAGRCSGLGNGASVTPRWRSSSAAQPPTSTSTSTWVAMEAVEPIRRSSSRQTSHVDDLVV